MNADTGGAPWVSSMPSMSINGELLDAQVGRETVFGWYWVEAFVRDHIFPAHRCGTGVMELLIMRGRRTPLMITRTLSMHTAHCTVFNTGRNKCRSCSKTFEGILESPSYRGCR